MLDAPTAAALAADLFAVEGEIVALPSYDDQNFRVGDSWVLKATRTGGDALEMQVALYAYLAGAGHPVPAVRPARDGRAVVERDGVWLYMVSFLPGTVYARALDAVDLGKLGGAFGRISRSLLAHEDPRAARRLDHWDLARAQGVRPFLEHLADDEQRGIVAAVLDAHEPEMHAFLRHCVCHNDLNEHNVLVDPATGDVTGVLDLGDAVWTPLVHEIAIAGAYAIQNRDDPLAALCQLVCGYDAELPLSALELELLLPLVRTRLAVSVTMAASKRASEPDNAYASVSEASGWRALRALAGVDAAAAAAALRAACGRPAADETPLTVRLLRDPAVRPMLPPAVQQGPFVTLDLTAGSDLAADLSALAADEPAFTAAVWARMAAAASPCAVGRWDEVREIYNGEQFQGADARKLHIAVDVFVEAGTPLMSPLDGVVESTANLDAQYDYGPVVIVNHGEFSLLYGHLSPESLQLAAPGDAVAAGQVVGHVGSPPGNGNWPPHAHVQLIVAPALALDDDGGGWAARRPEGGDFPGVCRVAEREAALRRCPNPQCVLRLAGAGVPL